MGDTELELVEGGLFQLRWRNTDENGHVATLDGTITTIDPPRLLEISADWGSTAAGWHLHLDALATVLAGGEVDIAHPDDLFAPLQQAYTEKYGAPPEPG